jgi:GNAT superfamily N-acetyltransferase
VTGPELNKLYILEWFCGKGIGYKLLQAAEQRALSRGDKLMWLWVLDSNERAVSFYERQQYQWIGNASFRMEVNSYDNKVMLKQLA